MHNHNFFAVDGQPSGPGFTVGFPLELRAPIDRTDLCEVRGKHLVYLRELQKGQSVYTPPEGFGPSAADYDIVVENRTTGADVRVQGGRPPSKLVFWSIRTTLGPEPHVTVRAAPGEEANWKIAYRFYTL